MGCNNNILRKHFQYTYLFPRLCGPLQTLRLLRQLRVLRAPHEALNLASDACVGRLCCVQGSTGVASMANSERSDQRGGVDIRTSRRCQRQPSSTALPSLQHWRGRGGWGENVTEEQRRDTPGHSEDLYGIGSGPHSQSATHHRLHFRTVVISPQKCQCRLNYQKLN